MEPVQIVCSLVQGGLDCGGWSFVSEGTTQLQGMLLLCFGMVAGLGIGAFSMLYDQREFKKKMRDLGYGHILGELYGASEKWQPPQKTKTARDVV